MDILDGRVTKSYDCHTCGSIYKVTYDDDEVDIGYSSLPEYCPFCGTKHEDTVKFFLSNMLFNFS